MLPRSYQSQRCSIAKTLEIIGDRWTMLIIREAFSGTRRFDEFQRHLGIARTVLTDRLGRLVEEGVLARVPYQERPARFEYRLTEKGTDLWPVLMALLSWGDRHAMDGEPPVVLVHRGCGGGVDGRRMCDRCGAALGPHDVRTSGLALDRVGGGPCQQEAASDQPVAKATVPRQVALR